MKRKIDVVETPAELPSGAFPKLALPIQPPFPPMEARRSDRLPPGDRWLFEPKWDGFRALVFKAGDQVAIQSKAGQPLGRYFPEVVEAIRQLPENELVLDGEIVVPAGDRLSFDDLLLRIHPAASRVAKLAAESPAQYFVFDLLVAPGKRGGSLADRTLEERRAALEKWFRRAGKQLLKMSPATTDRKLAQRWFDEFGALGLDGVMAKKLDSTYRSGERDGMIKVKHFNSADCVVGGYRYASGSSDIGSLLLGLYDDDENLVFIGHTSSFNQEQRKKLKGVVEPLRGKNPFSVRIPGGPSRWSNERSGEWEPVTPRLVCEVEYDYFSQNRFRHGSKFLRWRPDKKPKQCTMDQVQPEGRSGTLEKLGMQ